ncbi:protein SCAR2-like [Oryza brachyantha]|uniref:protein SCAR2-like n=1 Tax=Oryza brachyantha TaxID=4533 RepID=UPI001ADB69FB|nr:protein SCAR2-like [Oryza brachyantha]
MPLTRHKVANEYSLGGRDLYRRADQHDPEALLDGVAMAGLVGALRQLGDLAEFAAQVFHGLSDEVMTVSARGHGLMLRVQQLEAELPLVEKDSCHADYLYIASNRGIYWHSNLRLDNGVVTKGDTPRFIMDSIKQCHGPPKLFMLDKYDIGGEGACLKRYTDPSFFKTDSACSSMLEQGIQRERRPLRAMEIRPILQNSEIFRPPNAANNDSKLETDLSGKALDKVPTGRRQLKYRQLNGSLSQSFRQQVQNLYRETSPDEKPCSMNHSEVQISFTDSPDTNTEERDIMVDTFSSMDKSREDNYVMHGNNRSIPEEALSRSSDARSTGRSKGYNSEVDIYVDALTTMDSEVETDTENRDHGHVFEPVESSKSCSDVHVVVVSGSISFRNNGSTVPNSEDVVPAKEEKDDHHQEYVCIPSPQAKPVSGEHERRSSLEELFAQERPVYCEHERTSSVEELLVGDVHASEPNMRTSATESNTNGSVSSAATNDALGTIKKEKDNLSIAAISFKKTASKQSKYVGGMELIASKVGILPRKLSKKQDLFSDSLRNMAKQLLELKINSTEETELYEFEANGDGCDMKCLEISRPPIKIMENAMQTFPSDSPQDNIDSRKCKAEEVNQEYDHDVPPSDSPQDSVDGHAFQDIALLSSQEEQQCAGAVTDNKLLDHTPEHTQDKIENIYTEVVPENASDVSEELKEGSISEGNVNEEDAEESNKLLDHTPEHTQDKIGEHLYREVTENIYTEVVPENASNVSEELKEGSISEGNVNEEDAEESNKLLDHTPEHTQDKIGEHLYREVTENIYTEVVPENASDVSEELKEGSISEGNVNEEDVEESNKLLDRTPEHTQDKIGEHLHKEVTENIYTEVVPENVSDIGEELKEGSISEGNVNEEDVEESNKLLDRTPEHTQDKIGEHLHREVTENIYTEVVPENVSDIGELKEGSISEGNVNEEDAEESNKLLDHTPEHTQDKIGEHLHREVTENIYTEVVPENASDIGEELKEGSISEGNVNEEDAEESNESDIYALDEETEYIEGQVVSDDLVSSPISSNQSDDPCQITPLALSDADDTVAGKSADNDISGMHITLSGTITESDVSTVVVESVTTNDVAMHHNEQWCLHPETTLPQDLTPVNNCEVVGQNEPLPLCSSSMVGGTPDLSVDSEEMHENPNMCNDNSTNLFRDALAPDSKDVPLPNISSFDWMLNGVMQKSLNVLPAKTHIEILHENYSSEDTEDAPPPLPPLPPMQWRATKLQRGSAPLSAKFGKPPRPKPPVKCQENESYSSQDKRNQDLQEVSLQNGLTPVTLEEEMVVATVSNEVQKNTITGGDSEESHLKRLNEYDVQVSNPFSASEYKSVGVPSVEGDSLETSQLSELIVIPEETWSELVDVKSIPGQEKGAKHQLSTGVFDCYGMHANSLSTENRDQYKGYDQKKKEFSAEESNTIADSLEKKPNGVTPDTQNPDFSVQKEDREYGSYGTARELSSSEEAVAKLSPHRVPEPPKYPQLQVTSHDRSMLKKAPTLVPSIKLLDEKSTIWGQIKNKSFNLKPVLAKRPNVMGAPRTNLQVVAILERANAIRQAVADDDDEDSWSE